MSRYNPALLMVVTIAVTLGFVGFLGGNWAANRGSSCYLDANGQRVCPLTVNHESAAAPAAVTAPAVQTVSQPQTLVDRKPLQHQVAQTLVEKKPRAVQAQPYMPQAQAPQCTSRAKCEPSQSSQGRRRLFDGGVGIFNRRWR